MNLKIFFLLMFCDLGFCAKILAFFPFPFKSHKMLAQVLVQELANRGHTVTFVTTFSNSVNKFNYREIFVGDKNLRSMALDTLFAEEPGISRIESTNSNPIIHFYKLQQLNYFLTEQTLLDPKVQSLLRENFDLVIMELFANDAHLALGHHFKAPIIVFTSIGASQITNDLVGNPEPYAHVPQVIFPYSDQMSFFQRCLNTLASATAEFYKHFLHLPLHQALINKYFPNFPPLYDLMANVSLVFLNSHTSISFARPFVPNMIEIGGYHLQNLTLNSRLKPGDPLKKFLDEANEGFIYFSIGTNLKSSHMSKDKRDVFLKIFKQLKQRVLWKWETNDLPELPPNIQISKWFPQQEIIAHPNCKAFLSHVGISSLIEAVNYGVPLVALPLFGDQPHNAKLVEKYGIGVKLDFVDINEKSLQWALDEVINNTKYRENMKKRSELFRDNQMHPLDKAIYWTEYVLRHKGASHLQSAAVRLTRFQYLLLDVVLFFITVITVLVLAVIFTCKKMKNQLLKAFCFKIKVD